MISITANDTGSVNIINKCLECCSYSNKWCKRIRRSIDDSEKIHKNCSLSTVTSYEFSIAAPIR